MCAYIIFVFFIVCLLSCAYLVSVFAREALYRKPGDTPLPCVRDRSHAVCRLPSVTNDRNDLDLESRPRASSHRPPRAREREKERERERKRERDARANASILPSSSSSSAAILRFSDSRAAAMTTTRGGTRERRARRKRAFGFALASVVSAATVARAQRWVSDARRRREDAKTRRREDAKTRRREDAKRADRPTDRLTHRRFACDRT